MDTTLSHLNSQRVLKQRNVLALAVIVLGVLLVAVTGAASTRDREVVLQPLTAHPTTISSAGVSRDYLEMVTRDVALMALNRSPESLTYWKDSLIRIADPAARGMLNRDLMKVVTEQQGTQISQYFTIDMIKVDPAALTSEVSGILHTVVGSKEVTKTPRKFQFIWTYQGLSLKLRAFGMVQKAEKVEDVQ